jgi:predicted Rossmann fold flavoprotein
MVCERGVTLKTEPDGRMFPDTDSSATIIDCLMREANRYGVEFRMNCEVKKISLNDAGKFLLDTTNGQHMADYVCIASGGYPKLSMFDWLIQPGHQVASPVPSLFTFNLPQHSITQLMGVSVDPVRVKIEGSKLVEEGPVLITHWGLSGPAILRLSAWGARELAEKNYHFKVHLHWLPDLKEPEIKEQFASFRIEFPTRKLSNLNFGTFPTGSGYIFYRRLV